VRPRVVLCGSYHQAPEQLQRLFRELEATGCRVLSPVTVNFNAADFQTTPAEADLTPCEIERFHLRTIRDTDFVMLHAPAGYIGLSAAYELGFASALGKPVFALTEPTDTMLMTRVRVVSSVFEALEQLQLSAS
jgi:nucleoside 2-deoxyribosyltransferase